MRGFRLVVPAVLLVLAVGLAGATTLVKMDFSDLVKAADKVVVGTVTDMTGEWDAGRNFIHTNVTLSVEQSFIGSAPAQVVVRTPGGEADGVAMRADGAATFEVGERVLVFLTTWEDGTAKVLGYVQGKSRLFEAADGKRRLNGGVVNGRSLDGVLAEIQHGPNHNIQLRPVR